MLVTLLFLQTFAWAEQLTVMYGMYIGLASDTLRAQCIPLSKEGIWGPEYHWGEHSCNLLGIVSLIANLLTKDQMNLVARDTQSCTA